MESPANKQPLTHLKLIDKRDSCGQTKWIYSIRLRLQLLFASAGVIAGIWWYDVKPKIERILQMKGILTITRAMAERINVHEMAVEFVFMFKRDNESGQFIAADDNYQENAEHFHWNHAIVMRFCDMRLLENQPHHIAKAQESLWRERSLQLRDTLTAEKIVKYVDNACHTNAEFCIFDFWHSKAWWQQHVLNDHPGWIFRQGNDYVDQAKSARLLNHLTRVLLQNHRVVGIGKAVEILKRMPDRKIDLLKRLYVEPIAGSLFASYISTIFMHNKQQHGLNTKHAATQKNGADGLIDKRQRDPLRSDRAFDAKIYLDMCASCDKREIFEIMLSINIKGHHDNLSQGSWQNNDEEMIPPIKCLCEKCCMLRDVANAWQYFDCGVCAWLRLEFNRRFYAKVCALLSPLILQHVNGAHIIYTSYKNEFTTRDKFVANFVNYYAFYENNEQPLTMDKCYGKMRQMVSTIFLFGNINWTLIEKAVANGVPGNSISLNQQSLFKSLDNTLYSIFSENSIYRMSKETRQKAVSVNAPYVNRGLGMVPNCGINAFTAKIEFIFSD